MRAWRPLLGSPDSPDNSTQQPNKPDDEVAAIVDVLEATVSNLPGFENVPREELRTLILLEEKVETTLDDIIEDDDTHEQEESVATN